jgi:hypothetical protein
MKLLIVQLSLFFCYFITLKSKYSPKLDAVKCQKCAISKSNVSFQRIKITGDKVVCMNVLYASSIHQIDYKWCDSSQATSDSYDIIGV